MIQFENHLTGADPLSLPVTEARADWYGVGGVPHVRIDGSDWVLGASTCESAYQTYRDRFDQRMALTGGESKIRVDGSFEVVDGMPAEVSITATFRVLETIAAFDLRATFVIAEDGVVWCCGAGDNDTWDHVTRVILEEPVDLAGIGDSVAVQASVPIVEGPETWDAWNTANIDVVAFLQDALTLEVHQAVLLTRAGSASAGEPRRLDSTARLAAHPNPFRPGTRLTFTVAGDGGPARLSVFDATGRRVRTLLQGHVPGGRHEASWDGRDGSGRLLPAGVYVVRLQTPGDQRVAKVIRLD